MHFNRRIKVLNKKPTKSQIRCNLIKNKVKQYSKLRQVFTISCLIGCIFQFYELTEDYLRFETRLTIDIDMHFQTHTSMPAITVCIDKIINYTKLEEGFPQFRQEIMRYNKTGSSLDPILQFSNVYKFLNYKKFKNDIVQKKNGSHKGFSKVTLS